MLSRVLSSLRRHSKLLVVLELSLLMQLSEGKEQVQRWGQRRPTVTPGHVSSLSAGHEDTEARSWVTDDGGRQN